MIKKESLSYLGFTHSNEKTQDVNLRYDGKKLQAEIEIHQPLPRRHHMIALDKHRLRVTGFPQKSCLWNPESKLH